MIKKRKCKVNHIVMCLYILECSILRKVEDKRKTDRCATPKEKN